MAKIVKIPLVMKNGEKATDMKSLIANFDVESVVGYFLDGKLEKWLNDRYYEEEADAIAKIDRDDPSLAKRLCEVFGVEYEFAEEIDTKEIARRNERFARLKQLTDDEDILQNIDAVAFDQEDLADLYDKGVEKIYLCEGEFRIPKSKQHLTYSVLGNAHVNGLFESKSQIVAEPASTAQLEIEISEELELNSSQEKSFKNARIIISSTIQSGGKLLFENCEIVCNRTAQNTSSFSYTNTFELSGGSLEFKNCRINFECKESKNSWRRACFIGGECATVKFDHCEFIRCMNMISSMESGEIFFESCTSYELFAPLVCDGEAERILITDCSFVANDEAFLPEKLDTYNNSALFINNTDSFQIINSVFEGFVKGVVCGGETISIKGSKFVECSGIVCGNDNEVNLEDCILERCVHLFKNEQLTLTKCQFINCYGKVEAAEFTCDNCSYKNGFTYFEVPHYSSGRGESNFIKCTFENINRQEAVCQLSSSLSNGFRYIKIEDFEAEEFFEGINALIDVGNTGEMKGCKFENIDVGDIRFIITVGKYMDIERCVFSNCAAEDDILDRVVYTHYTGGFFDRGTKQQASYYIKSCKGLSE